MKNRYAFAGLFTALVISSSQLALAADSVTYQENEAGFCSADGVPVEKKYSNYKGDGYVNVNNQKNATIAWSISANNKGTYTVAFRFANGSSSSRSAILTINGTDYRVTMPTTGSWNKWKTVKVSSVYLSKGQNSINLRSASNDGLANIDSLTISGGKTKAASCQSVAPHPSYISNLVTGCDGQASGLTAKDEVFYVAPNGSSSGSGKSFSSAMDFTTAMKKVGAGDMILLKPGKYSIDYKSNSKNTINFSKSGKKKSPIYVVAANCGKAVFDFSFPEKKWVQNSYGFYVTGDYWYFKGIEITRAGYQGAYVTGEHNTFENCAFHNNRNTGLEINKGGSYTTVINSDAYMNYDPKKDGSMADGFGPKQKQGPGNAFYGCRAWLNSDDGFDTFDSPQSVIIDQSWAFRNGVDVWHYGNFSGNGNGFKLGGNRAVQNNVITRSVAFENVVKGFDQNNNAGGIRVINNISYKNGINYGFGNSLASGQEHYFRNNVSLSGSNSVKNADASKNSWDTGPSASSSDFISLDLSYATIERNKDGTLPFFPLFHLAPGSDLIDAGVNKGLDYNGSAPDLGAFERE